MKKFWKVANFRLKAGLIITAFFLIIGFVVYYFPHTDPFTFNTYPNKLGASAEHWLGTTSMGQDVVWLLIESIHNSLAIGLIVAFLGTVVGVLVGLLAGFAGGALDRVLMVITDTFDGHPVSADSDYDDIFDERQLDDDRHGAGACHVCMGLAQPADPVHGAEHQGRDFIHGPLFRRKHAADCRHGNSSLCAYLVSQTL